MVLDIHKDQCGYNVGYGKGLQRWICPICCKQKELMASPRANGASAVPGVSPGRGLLIPHGYLHPDKSEHSEAQSSSRIAGA